jgi:hypothetical protein
MSISILGALGGVKLLADARKLIEKEGYSQTSTLDPYDKSFSLFGALAKSCGASRRMIQAYDGDLMSLGLTGQRLGTFVELVVFLESLVDQDLEEWCEDASREDVFNLIERACDRIKIAVS